MFKVIKSSQVIIDDEQYQISSPNKNSKIISNTETQNNLDALKLKATQFYENKINDAQNESNHIISEAFEKANSILKEAKEEGFQKGLEEGRKLGYADGKKNTDALIQEALEIKEEIRKNKNTLIQRVEQEVIDLTIRTVEKILNKRIQDDYEYIEGLIKLGLEKCAYTENLAIRISPDDYDYILTIKDKVLALSENISDIDIKQDKSLKQGSCIIDTPSGSIDSGIWTQFEQIKDLFEDMLRSE